MPQGTQNVLKTPHCEAKLRAWSLQALGTFPPSSQPTQCRSQAKGLPGRAEKDRMLSATSSKPLKLLSLFR